MSSPPLVSFFSLSHQAGDHRKDPRGVRILSSQRKSRPSPRSRFFLFWIVRIDSTFEGSLYAVKWPQALLSGRHGLSRRARRGEVGVGIVELGRIGT